MVDCHGLCNTTRDPHYRFPGELGPARKKRNFCCLRDQVRYLTSSHWCSRLIISYFNSLTPGKITHFRYYFQIYLWLITGILQLKLHSYVTCVPQNVTDGTTSLDQVETWWLTAPRHYLNQCRPRSLGISRPPMSEFIPTRPRSYLQMITASMFSHIKTFWCCDWNIPRKFLWAMES